MTIRPEMESLSDDQRDVLDAIAKWHGDGGDRPLILGGLAGTGKTTLVSLLPEVLPGARIAYAAYTGKAVSVLAAKLRGHGVVPECISTLHKLLYQPHGQVLCAESGEPLPEKAPCCRAHRGRENPCPPRHQVSFTPVAEPLAGLDLVVADEASMIPGPLWRDLIVHGVPVLAVGDHGQLPPVQSSFSLMAEPDLRLEKIHRQAADDPAGIAILNVARWAREQGRIPHGWYGPDVVKIKPHELGYAGLHPAEAGLVIVATNKARAFHNSALRAWHGRSGPPQAGDVVACLRNNREAGLFNGQRGVILETGPGVPSRGGDPATEMVIRMDGLDEPWAGAVAAAPFGSPAGGAAGSVRDRDLAVFDFGYAITCHRAQGSQAENVVVIEEGWPAPGTEERARWLYTSVTRASEKLTVAGW